MRKTQLPGLIFVDSGFKWLIGELGEEIGLDGDFDLGYFVT